MDVHTALDYIRKPLLFLVFGLSIIGVGIIVFNADSLFDNGEVVVLSSENPKNEVSDSSRNIVVEIAGAVHKPGVYELPQGSRVSDLISVSGGFASSVNKEYVSKSINQAQKLIDGQKILIPERGETLSIVTSSSPLISINSASKSELESLKGVGPATAQKIIDNRPYSTLEELTKKKAVSSSVFSNIKNEISL